MKKLLIPMVLATMMLGQSPAAKSSKHLSPAKPSIDTVIELVQGGMSESFIIKTLQSQGKAYSLSPEDMVKLQKAGVTENIISVMMDPKAPVTPPISKASTTPAPDSPAPPEMPATNGPSSGGAVPIPASPAATTAGSETPYPPDLQTSPVVIKRRLGINAFDYSTVKNAVTYWFNTDVNIGQGIRAMLETRLGQSDKITLVENAKIDDIFKGQDRSNTNRYDQGSKSKVGRMLAADCILYGDVVIFGADNKTKNRSLGAWGSRIPGVGKYIPYVDTFSGVSKENKAVVGITLRIVDAETGEVIKTAEARGESLRKSKEYSASAAGPGSAASGGSSMISSDFEKTMIGEATSDAVNKIVAVLDERIPQIPEKSRDIEGRVASVGTNSAYLALGKNDGVRVGDRFEVLEIKNEVLNPQTKEAIDVEAVKVGELVVTEVHDQAVIGNYGGQPLSAAYVNVPGKGYQVRLVSK